MDESEPTISPDLQEGSRSRPSPGFQRPVTRVPGIQFERVLTRPGPDERFSKSHLLQLDNPEPSVNVCYPSHFREGAVMEAGFLGYGATFMLDVVVCALVLVVPALIFSIYQVKVKRNYALHKVLQLSLAGVLVFAVAAFEIDIQLIHGGWENVVTENAVSSPPTDAQMFTIRKMLYVHLCFAVTTPILWAITIVLAWKRIPEPPAPSPHSSLHKKLGWLATIDLTFTSITGLIFYYLAFIVL